MRDYSATSVPVTYPSTSGIVTLTGTPRAICPDLLSIRDLGGADGWRGHLVRGLFRLLRLITGV